MRDLRRTVGTILIQNGKSLRVVRDILHHSNVSTTERYLGITPEELNSAYDSLDGWITKIKDFDFYPQNAII